MILRSISDSKIADVHFWRGTIVACKPTPQLEAAHTLEDEGPTVSRSTGRVYKSLALLANYETRL